MVLTLATRESPLALWQANYIATQLRKYHRGLHVKLLGLTTRADQMLTAPLYKVGGKGLFVKELEEALLSGRADIAVHSMKDMPMELPAGLSVPVFCRRENPLDAFVAVKYTSFAHLPAGARVGTSSLRRKSQLLALRRDIDVHFLRGNVNTRLQKLAQGEFDAIILAAAGLERLGLATHIRHTFDATAMLPAVSQGVLGVECRSEDKKTQKLLAPLHHADTAACVLAERALCRRLGAGCHAPVASYAEWCAASQALTLRGLVASPDGKTVLRIKQIGAYQAAEALGLSVANALLAAGAQPLLAVPV